jgi:hypothetical protein
MPIGRKAYVAEDGRDLVFFYDMDALILVEEAAKCGVKAIFERMLIGDVRLGDLRALIWGGLQRHHPEITLADATALIESEGEAMGAAIRDALAAAMPDPKEGRDGQNPPIGKRAGTGKSSTRTGAARGSTRTASGGRRRGSTS